MRNTINNTNKYNAQNSDLSSFNSVKRGSFVGSEDTVETFKRHHDYEIYACVSRHSYKHS